MRMRGKKNEKMLYYQQCEKEKKRLRYIYIYINIYEIKNDTK